MKKLTIRALLAIAASVQCASVSATTVYLIGIGLRDGDGTYYSSATPSGSPNLVFNGSDGLPGNTAAWDWTGGVLTMTGGTLRVNQHNSPTGVVLSDYVTGLVIDTTTGITSATSYLCIEGNLGPTTGVNNCANTTFGADLGNDSSVAYNVGGDAGCEVRTVGDDDVSGTPAAFRGLYSHGAGTPAAGCGDNTGRGAFDMIHVVLNQLGVGGNVVLANQDGPLIGACLQPGSAAAIDPAGLCGRAHWMIFNGLVAPVPPAVWLFASALGVLGWIRRAAQPGTGL